MQFIFDHMASFFALTGVLLIFGLIQIRGTQSASDAVINHMVYSEIVGFSEYLQIDLINMRTQTQVDNAIAAGNFTGGAAYQCSITKSTDVTTSFTFPTMGDPLSGYAAANPDDSEIILVNYILTDTGKTITIPSGSSYETVILYKIERIVDGKNTGESNEYVTHFLVEFLNKGSGNFSSNSAACSTDLSKVRFELKFATEGIEYATKDQKNTSQTNISRFGSTVDLPNME